MKNIRPSAAKRSSGRAGARSNSTGPRGPSALAGNGTRFVSEIDLVRERFARRSLGKAPADDPLDPAVILRMQERERMLVDLIGSCGLRPMRQKRVFDIGCGVGNDLLTLIRLGYQPENLSGCDLRESSVEVARHRLPRACTILAGDASTLPLDDESFDIVLQSTVFTSLLDDRFRRRLAKRMWALAKPGGGILWYDFAYDNPSNRDVRGVPLRRVQDLFPDGAITARRLTLAPPIGRRATRIHPRLYGILNSVPLLRTHLLCWIAKR